MRFLKKSLLVAAALSMSLSLAQTYEDASLAYDNENYELALKELEPLVADGDAQAQNLLGLMYDYGDGVEMDDVKAFELYKLAAEQGYSDAQYNLAVMYDEGEGTELDDVKALEWYLKAADQGDMDATYNAAIMYDEGEGVEVDDARAVELYTIAAEAGDGYAQFNLALMYYYGEGTSKNKEEAAYWMQKAADQDVEDAAEALEDIKG